MTTPFHFIINELSSINDFLRFGLSEANKAELYYGHGTDNAWDDIRFLILESLFLPFDCDHQLCLAKLTNDEKELLVERLERRILDKIPVPYILQKAYFCGLSFYVDERVLIPRSPIAELIKKRFSPWINPTGVTQILDLCTGSGCIAIACAQAFPDAHVDAVDLSLDALQVAAVNCEQLDLFDQVELFQSDCWENVPEKRYDIIVSNPPYVNEDEMGTLPQEYLYEPDFALRAENNGLAVVTKILENAHRFLNEHGILVVEVGSSEAALIEAHPNLPFTWLDFIHGGEGIFLLTYHQLQNYFEHR